MRCMRAAIYTRVSQDSRGDARSVQEQERECSAWVEREGWEALGVWSDNDISASKYAKKRRPGWQALTDRLEASEVDVLVVWEPSRATRDRRVWAALAAICEEHAVRFGCNGRVYDLTDPDDAFQLDLFFALATRESGATRKRVLRSTRASAIAGRPHGKLLYGYRRTYREGSQGPELVAQVIVDEHAFRGSPTRRAVRTRGVVPVTCSLASPSAACAKAGWGLRRTATIRRTSASAGSTLVGRSSPSSNSLRRSSSSDSPARTRWPC